jgi:hypothetical protein
VLYLHVGPTPHGTRFELRDRPPRATRGRLSTAEALGDRIADDNIDLVLAQRLAGLLGAALGTRHSPAGGTIFTLELPAALAVPPREARQSTVH